jgi:hypothetical protein
MVTERKVTKRKADRIVKSGIKKTAKKGNKDSRVLRTWQIRVVVDRVR